jgi:hypothetical protein
MTGTTETWASFLLASGGSIPTAGLAWGKSHRHAASLSKGDDVLAWLRIIGIEVSDDPEIQGIRSPVSLVENMLSLKKLCMKEAQHKGVGIIEDDPSTPFKT